MKGSEALHEILLSAGLRGLQLFYFIREDRFFVWKHKNDVKRPTVQSRYQVVNVQEDSQIISEEELTAFQNCIVRRINASEHKESSAVTV